MSVRKYRNSLNHEFIFISFIILLSVSILFITVWIYDVSASGRINLTFNSTNHSSNNTFDFSNIVPLEYDLRNGTIVNGTIAFAQYETPVTFEQINNSYVYEGDIILNERLPEEIDRAAIDKFFTASHWPQGIVHYKIDPNIPNQKRISDAIEQWEGKTPVRFVQLKEFDNSNIKDYILFERSSGSTCMSAVGRIGGQQPLYVTDGCTTGTVMHELGHALGLWHEQTRNDRDKYIQIRYEYVKSDKKSNFDQHLCTGKSQLYGCEGPLDVGPYDYCSIMHYHPLAFSKYPWDDSKTTLVPRQQVSNCEIGQRSFLSEGDINAIKYLYGTDDEDSDSSNTDLSSGENQLNCKFSFFNDCAVIQADVSEGNNQSNKN